MIKIGSRVEIKNLTKEICGMMGIEDMNHPDKYILQVIDENVFGWCLVKNTNYDWDIQRWFRRDELKKYKKLKKITQDKNVKVISTEESLKDIEPINWDKAVLKGNKKVIIKGEDGNK